MTKLATKTTRKRVSKEFRQQQLIQATIETIAKSGLSETRLAKVSQIAGLSQGIVNLHFRSKDTLLIETLKYLRDEYVERWLKVLNSHPGNPAKTLAALARLDFDRVVVSRKKLAVWFAFWGEAKSNQAYQKICKECDDNYAASTTQIIADLIREGGYSDLNAEGVAKGFMSLVDGLWLGIHIAPSPSARQEALTVTMDHLAHYFPKHADIFKA